MHPQIVLITDTLMDRKYKIISNKPGGIGRGLNSTSQYLFKTLCRGISHSSQGGSNPPDPSTNTALHKSNTFHAIWSDPAASISSADLLTTHSHYGSPNGRPSLRGYPRIPDAVVHRVNPVNWVATSLGNELWSFSLYEEF